MPREARDVYVKVRLKRSEVEHIDQIADACGWNRSEFVRAALVVALDRLDELRKVYPDANGLRALPDQLDRDQPAPAATGP